MIIGLGDAQGETLQIYQTISGSWSFASVQQISVNIDKLVQGVGIPLMFMSTCE